MIWFPQTFQHVLFAFFSGLLRCFTQEMGSQFMATLPLEPNLKQDICVANQYAVPTFLAGRIWFDLIRTFNASVLVLVCLSKRFCDHAAEPAMAMPYYCCDMKQLHEICCIVTDQLTPRLLDGRIWFDFFSTFNMSVLVPVFLPLRIWGDAVFQDVVEIEKALWSSGSHLSDPQQVLFFWGEQSRNTSGSSYTQESFETQGVWSPFRRKCQTQQPQQRQNLDWKVLFKEPPCPCIETCQLGMVYLPRIRELAVVAVPSLLVVCEISRQCFETQQKSIQKGSNNIP